MFVVLDVLRIRTSGKSVGLQDGNVRPLVELELNPGLRFAISGSSLVPLVSAMPLASV